MNEGEQLPAELPKAEKRTAGRTGLDATPLEIRTHHVDIDGAIEAHVRERASRKLGKYAEQLTRITVRFEDQNGPKGGVDTLCRVDFLMVSGPELVVSELGEGLRDAFNKAVASAERTLRRDLQRKGRASGGRGKAAAGRRGGRAGGGPPAR